MFLYGTDGATARLFAARLRGIAPRRRLPLVPSFALAAFAEAAAAPATSIQRGANGTVKKVCERQLLRSEKHQRLRLARLLFF